jgi:hypothetical protein
LQNEYEFIALRRQVAQRIGKPAFPDASPVEVIDAALERALDSRSRRSITGRQAETAGLQTGSSEDSAIPIPHV